MHLILIGRSVSWQHGDDMHCRSVIMPVDIKLNVLIRKSQYCKLQAAFKFFFFPPVPAVAELFL